MTLINNLRQLVESHYSRGAYRKIDNILTKAHNKLPISGFELFAAENIAWGQAPDNDYALVALGGLSALTLLYGSAHTAAYFTNRLRQPLEVTLSLNVPKGTDKKYIEWLHDDPKYVAELLKSLPRLPAEQLGIDFASVEDAVRQELKGVEGKDPGPFPQPKRYSLVPYILSIAGAGGCYVAFFPEIYISRDVTKSKGEWLERANHALAHELVHAKGYTKEKEAQLLGHLACMNSNDPTLIRSTLIERLVRNFAITTKDGKSLEQRLAESDLPVDVEVMLEKAFKAWDRKTSLTAAQGLFSAIREPFVFISTGNRKSDYNKGFLRMLWVYEQKYGKV